MFFCSSKEIQENQCCLNFPTVFDSAGYCKQKHKEVTTGAFTHLPSRLHFDKLPSVHMYNVNIFPLGMFSDYSLRRHLMELSWPWASKAYVDMPIGPFENT